jgi:hypothetical protein
MRVSAWFVFVFFIFFCTRILAGPYAPEAGRPGSQALILGHGGIIAWATGFREYVPGEAVEDPWMDPQRAMGPATGKASDVLSLGRGGSIVLTFDAPLMNREGWDFAVFGNSFSDTFLELAFVEVSTDGRNFVRFPTHSLTQNPVHAFGHVDPTDIDGFAGKYRAGFGTPFDLEDLKDFEAVRSGLVNLNDIPYLRLVDVVGDGSTQDHFGNKVYAPYPTKISAGFDLDGVAVLNGVPRESGGGEGDTEAPLVSRGMGGGGGCFLQGLLKNP